jgi:predicted oxidoreductase
MTTQTIGGNPHLQASRIIMGCMRIDSLSQQELQYLIDTAIDNGISYFDHADIYANGYCEELFGNSFRGNRENIILQTKCGIKPGAFDFSKEHIISSVENSLSRLKTSYLDILLLHRPDTLVDPEEVADAFETLFQQGKVLHFGVSNQSPNQLALLQKNVQHKILINQLQFSIMHSGIIDAGFNVNMKNEQAINKDGGVLDYCRLHDITIQAWSPFTYGFFEGTFLDNDRFWQLNQTLQEIGNKYNVSKTAIATAWILRHPAKIQVVSGTTKAHRLKEICQGTSLILTREEWYQIYLAAGNKLP